MTRPPLDVLRDAIQTYIDDVVPDEEQLAAYVADWWAALAAVEKLVEAARGLYEVVEMDESVGVCLSSRAESLILGDSLRPFAGHDRLTK